MKYVCDPAGRKSQLCSGGTYFRARDMPDRPGRGGRQEDERDGAGAVGRVKLNVEPSPGMLSMRSERS